MLFESDKTLEPGAGRSKSLAISIGFHLCLFILVSVSPGFLSTSARRAIRISGEDFDRERFELTELFLPPELLEPEPVPEPEAPPDAPLVAIAPVAPIPAPEAAPPPPPPPPDPQPEPEPDPEDEVLLPPPIIGPDDVIEEGARPDAPVDSPEGPDEQPRITLDEPGRNEGPEGDDGDGGDGLDDEELQPDSEEVEARTPTEDEDEDEPDPQSLENTNPDALLLPDLRRRASVIVEESVAESRRELGRVRSAGTDGIEDVVPDFSTTEPTILSETRGYDFGPYMNQVVNRVRVNWYSLIPQAARLLQLQGRVVIIFVIEKDGRVVNERFFSSSGSDQLDTAAMSAIRTSNPFSPIPDDFEGDNLVLQFTFLYNIS